MTQAVPAFEGVYDVPSAASYLKAAREFPKAYRVTSRQLIRWIRKGLAHPSLVNTHGRDLMMGFEDLISMRVIVALRSAGVSWKSIYNAEDWLRDNTRSNRPFANQVIWTQRSDVLTGFGNELVAASKHGQLAMSFLRDYLIPVSGLQFQESVASSWEPYPLVLLDPGIQFGEPCIQGTRIPTRAVWGLVRGGDPVSLVKRSYGISDQQLNAALAWEDRLAA